MIPYALVKFCAEVVRRARLERPAVGHHRLDAQRVAGAGELLGLGLASLDDRDGQPVLGELAVALEHGLDLGGRLLVGGVEGVALLPEELRGAQEQAGSLLPAHHVAPTG